MSPEEVYCILKNKIDQLSGPAISEAVAAYLEDHPEAFALDLLGLYKDDQGYICQTEEV